MYKTLRVPLTIFATSEKRVTYNEKSLSSTTISKSICQIKTVEMLTSEIFYLIRDRANNILMNNKTIII